MTCYKSQNVFIKQQQHAMQMPRISTHYQSIHMLVTGCMCWKQKQIAWIFRYV